MKRFYLKAIPVLTEQLTSIVALVDFFFFFFKPKFQALIPMPYPINFAQDCNSQVMFSVIVNITNDLI